VLARGTKPKVCGCGGGMFSVDRRVPWEPFRNLHPGDARVMKQYRICREGMDQT
jgi:hypothetical protein